MDRRSAVVSLLRSIGAQTKRLGRRPICAEALSCPPEEAATRREDGRLSWRGQELAKQIFELFDGDQDGSLSRSEFSHYLAGVGRMMETEQGVHELPMSLEQFVVYREAIELNWPIEVDAVTAGLSGTTVVLEEWARCAAEFDLLDRDFDKSGEAHGKVPAVAFQQLCYNCGGDAYFTAECELSTARQAAHNSVCTSVRKAYAKRHAFEDTIQRSTTEDDPAYVYREAFLGWWFSNRPRPDDRAISRLALACTKALCSFARQIFRTATKVANAIFSQFARGILPFGRIQNAKSCSVANLDVEVHIGSLDRSDNGSGASLELRFGMIENTQPFLTQMQIPSGAGSSIVVDFALQPSADTTVLLHLKKQLVKFFNLCFLADLKRLPGDFLGVRVLIVHGSDGSSPRFARVQLLWRATIDGWLQRSAGLGSVLDLIHNAKASLRINKTLTDMLLNDTLNPNYGLEISAKASASYANFLCGLLLEEELYARRERAIIKQREEALERKAQRKAHERTLASHGPILEMNELSGLGVMPLPTKAAKIAEPIYRQRCKYEKALDRHLWRIVRCLKGTNQLQLELSFRHVHEFLFENTFLRNFIDANTSRRLGNLLDGKGALSACWRRVSVAIADELSKLSTEIEKIEALDRERRAADAKAEAERLNSMSPVDRKRLAFAREMMKLQRNLGSKFSSRETTADIAERASVQRSQPYRQQNAHVDLLRRVQVNHAKAARVALDLYALCCDTLLGPACVTLHSDRFCLSVDIDGFDVFDVLPSLSPECHSSRKVPQA